MYPIQFLNNFIVRKVQLAPLLLCPALLAQNFADQKEAEVCEVDGQPDALHPDLCGVHATGQILSHFVEKCETILLLNQVLHYHKNVSDDLLSEKNPNTFLKYLGKASFFAGFWGLFVFFTVSS